MALYPAILEKLRIALRVGGWFARSGFAIGRHAAFWVVVGCGVVGVLSQGTDVTVAPLRSTSLFFLVVVVLWPVVLGSSLWAGESERRLRPLVCPMRLGPAGFFVAAVMGRFVPAGAAASVMVLVAAVQKASLFQADFMWRLAWVLAMLVGITAVSGFWSVVTNSPAGGMVALFQLLLGTPARLSLQRTIGSFAGYVSLAWLFPFPLVTHMSPVDLDLPRLCVEWLAVAGVWLALALGVVRWRRL